jgi:hypothetical protein
LLAPKVDREREGTMISRTGMEIRQLKFGAVWRCEPQDSLRNGSLSTTGGLWS